MVSQPLLSELRVILKEDYQLSVDDNELSEIGNSIVNFFELLITIQQERKQYGESENAT